MVGNHPVRLTAQENRKPGKDGPPSEPGWKPLLPRKGYASCVFYKQAVGSSPNEEQMNNLQVYIEENFTLDGVSCHLVSNIIQYVAAQGEEEAVVLDMLENLLDGIGIEREEIVKAALNI